MVLREGAQPRGVGFAKEMTAGLLLDDFVWLLLNDLICHCDLLVELLLDAAN